jgi:hypothetical protein
MQKRSTTKIGHSTTANGMNNYTMTIDKQTRFVIMYKGKVVKKYWSLSDARNFLDYAENHERTKATMATQV